MSTLVPCLYGSVGRWTPAQVRLTPPVKVIWSAAKADDYVGPPILGYDLAFGVSRPHGLRGLDAATGKEVWRFETERAWGSCQLYDGRLLTTPRPGVLAVLDPATGAQKDTFSVADLSLYNGVVVGERIVGPLAMGTLAAWDMTSRDFAWRVSSEWRTHVLAAGNDTICVAEESAYVALDVGSGAERWRCDVTEIGRHRTILWGERPGTATGRPVVAGGTVYGGVSGGWLLAFDLASGAIRWRVQVAGLAPRLYTLAANGDLIYLSDDELTVIEAATGAVRLRSALVDPDGASGGGPFAPIAVSEEFVWTVDKRGQLVAIARADARVTVCFNLAGRLADPPVIGDGRLFVVTLDGQLRVFAAAKS